MHKSMLPLNIVLVHFHRKNEKFCVELEKDCKTVWVQYLVLFIGSSFFVLQLDLYP